MRLHLTWMLLAAALLMGGCPEKKTTEPTTAPTTETTPTDPDSNPEPATETTEGSDSAPVE